MKDGWAASLSQKNRTLIHQNPYITLLEQLNVVLELTKNLHNLFSEGASHRK